MSALKMTVALIVKSTINTGVSTVRKTGVSSKYGKLSSMQPGVCITFSNIQSRYLSYQTLNKNMEYITDKKIAPLKMDPVTMKFERTIEKPLCVVLPWIGSKQKIIHKYSQLYLEQGYDVVTCRVTPWQVMWPKKGSQIVALNLLKFLEANAAFNPLVLHGFSVGGYMWGEVCLHAAKDVAKYQPIMDKVKGQIWDSITDIDQIPIGVSKGMFPFNAFLQRSFENLIKLHMKTFYEEATQFYHGGSDSFHINMVHAPALFLLSKTDPIGTVKISKSVHDSWVEKMGMETTWQCWEKSPHVGHYTHHKEEYLTLMMNHLDGLGLLTDPKKMLVIK